jgi:predicted nucleic acid-binding protein
MSIDPSKFHLVNVVDTCSVWNVLSSSRLYGAAKEARCNFCITEFVRYECLVKKRGILKDTDRSLIERLEREQRSGAFQAHACSIDDLQRVAQLEQRKKLGKGELSSIAFAMKIGQAVMTDDQKARKLAHDSGALVQTTPHLYAWLIFSGRLSEADKGSVIQQHKDMGQILEPYFEDAHTKALVSMMNSQSRP